MHITLCRSHTGNASCQPSLLSRTHHRFVLLHACTLCNHDHHLRYLHITRSQHPPVAVPLLLEHYSYSQVKALCQHLSDSQLAHMVCSLQKGMRTERPHQQPRTTHPPQRPQRRCCSRRGAVGPQSCRIEERWCRDRGGDEAPSAGCG